MLPERSEFRGSGGEAEIREEGLRTRSLHRSRLGSVKSHSHVTINRNRKLSTASSPSSYKVWTSEEEEELDHYGYVLPGSPGSPERGQMLSKYIAFSHFIPHVKCVIVMLYKVTDQSFLVVPHSLQNISFRQKKFKPEEQSWCGAVESLSGV